MTAFENFVNLELPRRSAHLTVGIAGYDGDPNDVAAPAILKNSPQGTWYQRETPAIVWYRKQIGGAIGSTSWIVPAESSTSTPEFDANCTAGTAVGDAVYITGAKVGGKQQVATVDITDYNKVPAIGVVTAKTIATDCTVQYGGEVAIYSGLTPGRVYLIDQNGEPTSSLPSPGVDHYVQRLGVATSSDSLLLQVDVSLVKRRV